MADESVGGVKSDGGAESSAVSAEPYPEVSGDESGIVPPQNDRPTEWPKKIRTLTAAELDRLTIDSSGRFYWDGKLVNYETRTLGATDATPVSLEQSLDILERAAHEFSERKVPVPIEGAQLPRMAEAGSHRDHAAHLAEALAAPHVIRTTEQVRLTLTGLQSFGLAFAILGIALGAFGVAASGLVAAHQWGCRTGMIQAACPAPPPPAPQPPDIPA
jgi:hypothetical protein